MNVQGAKALEADAETVDGEKGCCGSGVVSSREKNLVIIGLVFGLLVLCLLTAIVMAIVIESLFPKQEYCLTDHCVKKAGSILRAMNMTADPCTDFFSYACGGWVEQYDVDDESEIAVLGRMQTKVYRKFNRIIENIKKTGIMNANSSTDNEEEVAYAGVKAIKTYDACTELYDDYDSAKLVDMLKEFGGWPMATENWNDQAKQKTEHLSVVLGDFGIPSLLAISVASDDHNSSKNVISISPPGPALIPDEHWDVIKEIAGEKNPKKQEITTDIQSLKSFYKEINKKLEEFPNKGKENTVVKDLKNHLNSKNFDFAKVIELLVYGKAPSGPDADTLSNAKVVIHRKDAINGILDEAGKLNGRVLNNYFAVNVILGHPLLIMKKLEPGINTQKSNPNVLTQLKEVCLQTVAKYLTFAMDHVFVYKQEKATGMANRLIKYIRAAFRKFILQYNWLDTPTRSKLEEKLKAMNEFVDYPDWLNDKKKVDEYYKDYNYNSASTIEAYVDMVKFATHKMYAEYNKTNDRSQWPNLTSLSISTVNAFYIPFQNNFVLPRAILNPPIYDEKNPKYLTFGSIGAIIGHEITHGFDSEGRQYDENGVLSKNIWSNYSSLEYKQLSDCFVDQYNKYVIDKTSNTTVNGSKTLGENIADNGGLREAYEAYRMWLKEVKKGRKELTLPGFAAFTPEQMFFISYGQTWCIAAGKDYLKKQVILDEHTPHNYRVIGTLSNMKSFATAFKCPIGSSMNPVNKCVLW